MNRLIARLLAWWRLAFPAKVESDGVKRESVRVTEMSELVGGSAVAVWRPLRKINHVLQGPEIRFKEGTRLFARHLRPEVARIIWAACMTAHDGQRWVTVSSLWRFIRETRDLHNSFDAVDFSIRDIPAASAAYRAQAAHAWGRRIADILGDDYDVVVHDAGSGLHVHVEYDPKGPSEVLTT